MIALAACTVDPASGEVVRADGRTDRLSPKELELLLYLRANPGRVVPRDELLERVWQYAPSVVSRAADTTIRRLREKVEADPTHPDHVLTAYGEGYRFVEPDDGAELTEEDDPEPFVGRGAEVRRLAASLRRPGTVALVLGPPGAGKTRLARHLAWRLGPSLRGGTVLVDLTESRDLAETALATASALGVRSGGTGSGVLRKATDALRARGPCLLVLDNCEGASASVAEAMGELRTSARDARFLATSRVVVPGADDTVQLGALSLPEAVALFEVLARRVRPDFAVEPVRAVVEALVERLERIPLAIALAAARVHALSPRAILDRLDDRFRVLAARGGDLRHPTLRAALDSSWDLLDEAERRALVACSAFRGGFDRAAARAVLGDGSDPVLDRLIDRSLLEPRGARIGGYAFVREYATERLSADPVEEDAVFRRHAAFFAQVEVRDHDRLVVDHLNLVAATERSIARRWTDLLGPVAVAALEGIARRGPYEVGLRLARDGLALDGLTVRDRVRLGIRQVALEQWTGTGDPFTTQAAVLAEARASGDDRLLADALRTTAVFLRATGRVEEAVAGLEEGVAVGRRLGDPDVVASLLCTYGATLRHLDRLDEARAAWEEVGERAQDPEFTSYALGNLALLERRAGRFDEARRLLERSFAHVVARGDLRSECVARMGLANLDIDLGRWAEAREQLEAALRLARELGSRETEAQILGNLALCERGLGDLGGARARGEAALEAVEPLGDPLAIAIARGNLAELDLLGGDPDLALAGLTRAIAMLESIGSRRNAAEFGVARVDARLALGDLAGARAEVDALEAATRPHRDPLLLARVLAVRGLVEVAEGRDARATLREAEAEAGPAGARSDTGLLLDRLRAALER